MLANKVSLKIVNCYYHPIKCYGKFYTIYRPIYMHKTVDKFIWIQIRYCARVCDYALIWLPILQIMQYNFTDITSSQKGIHQTHTKCQISYDTYWFWCTFFIPLILLLHNINNVCKNYLTWKVTSFSTNYYLLNWPLSSRIRNTEVKLIAWVKHKIVCKKGKYSSGWDEIKYIL